MARTIPKGIDSFVRLRQNNFFYIDKTKFIIDWWKDCDPVTLITRPRCFGKTLMLDTIRTFFSPQFAGHSDWFEELEVWQDEKLRSLHGTIPVIYLTFASIKCTNYADTISLIKKSLSWLYNDFSRQIDVSLFAEWEKRDFYSIQESMTDATAQTALCDLCMFLERHNFGRPIILLDEYETPLREAWLYGYWKELNTFMDGFLTSTFKANQYLERGLLTGATWVANESIFSGFNNLVVWDVTSDFYADCFGFTEQEVVTAMEEYELTDKEAVKQWYGGFVVGSTKDLYNPYSVANYLAEREIDLYWGQTYLSDLARKLIQRNGSGLTEEIGRLLEGESIIVHVDQQIALSLLGVYDFWTLLTAAGYVKLLSYECETEKGEIMIPNCEAHRLLEDLISD